MSYNLSILCIRQYQTRRVHLFPISFSRRGSYSSDEYNSHGQEKSRPEPLLTDNQVHWPNSLLIPHSWWYPAALVSILRMFLNEKDKSLNFQINQNLKIWIWFILKQSLGKTEDISMMLNWLKEFYNSSLKAHIGPLYKKITIPKLKSIS